MKKILPLSFLLISIFLLGVVLFPTVEKPEKLELEQTVIIDKGIEVSLVDISTTTNPESSINDNDSGITITFDFSPLKDDEVFLQVELNLKNNSSLYLPMSWLYAELLYDQQYKYVRDHSYGDDVDMLSEGNYYMLFRIPKSLEKNKPLQLNLFIMGKKYYVDVKLN